MKNRNNLEIKSILLVHDSKNGGYLLDFRDKADSYLFNWGNNHGIHSDFNLLWKNGSKIETKNSVGKFDENLVFTNNKQISYFNLSSKLNAQISLCSRFTDQDLGHSYLHEIIAFTKEVSEINRVLVTNYLSRKWNLTTTVDMDDDGFLDNIDSNPTSCDVIKPNKMGTSWYARNGGSSQTLNVCTRVQVKGCGDSKWSDLGETVCKNFYHAHYHGPMFQTPSNVKDLSNINTFRVYRVDPGNYNYGCLVKESSTDANWNTVNTSHTSDCVSGSLTNLN